MRHTASKSTIAIAIVGSIIFAVVLTVGTLFVMQKVAKKN